MKSLRRQLLIGSSCATLAVFAAIAGASYVLARGFLIGEMDHTLRSRALAVAAMIEFDGERLGVEAADLQRFPEYMGGAEAEYYLMRTTDGTRTARSPSFRPYGAGELSGVSGEGGRFVTLPDGRSGRAFSATVVPQLDLDEIARLGGRPPEVTVTVARAMPEFDRLTHRLRWWLPAACAVSAAVLMLLTTRLITRTLRPVCALARTIESIHADRLEARVPTASQPAELQPIVAGLNTLLSRLDDAFARERAFTDDVAHELRTPLAGLHTALEVCAARPRATEDYARTVRDCLAVAVRMRGMVESLLLLARAERGQVPVSLTAVPLRRLVEESVRRCRPAGPSTGVRLVINVDPVTRVNTDADLCSVILDNLFDNAFHYVDPAGEVRAWAEDSPDGAVILRVSNTGSRVRPEDAAHVFDRFWRGDPARGGTGRRCGLGLAISRKLAAVIDATLSAESTGEGMFIASLVISRPPEPPAARFDPNELSHLQEARA